MKGQKSFYSLNYTTNDFTLPGRRDVNTIGV